MPNFDKTPGDILFIVVSGARPALQTTERVRAEIAAGWRVRVIATPQANQWLDHDAIKRLTGQVTESAMLTPEKSWLEPAGNQVLASPVTLNTVTKWADGHADNLAIGLLCEALGAGIPITAELSLSQEFFNHPALPSAVGRLAGAGVTIRNHPDAALQPDWEDVLRSLRAS